MSSATGNRYLVGRMGGVRVLVRVNNRREGHADASSVGGLLPVPSAGVRTWLADAKSGTRTDSRCRTRTTKTPPSPPHRARAVRRPDTARASGNSTPMSVADSTCTKSPASHAPAADRGTRRRSINSISRCLSDDPWAAARIDGCTKPRPETVKMRDNPTPAEEAGRRSANAPSRSPRSNLRVSMRVPVDCEHQLNETAPR
jgi:hypothetical protein